jgi:multicomponent K+:H+ antiporter subunit E
MNPESMKSTPVTQPGRAGGWLDHPALSALLAGSWLALSHSLEPVHLLSAALIGLVLPRLLRPFMPEPSAIHWAPVPRLLAVVVWDIIMSNIAVAKLVLGPIASIHPGWIEVPLASQHHRVNALFASIITTTPGTVSAVIDEERGLILVHALSCDDAAAMAADMKTRYEEPLLKIFRQPSGGTA